MKKYWVLTCLFKYFIWVVPKIINKELMSDGVAGGQMARDRQHGKDADNPQKNAGEKGVYFERK